MFMNYIMHFMYIYTIAHMIAREVISEVCWYDNIYISIIYIYIYIYICIYIYMYTYNWSTCLCIIYAFHVYIYYSPHDRQRRDIWGEHVWVHKLHIFIYCTYMWLHKHFYRWIYLKVKGTIKMIQFFQRLFQICMMYIYLICIHFFIYYIYIQIHKHKHFHRQIYLKIRILLKKGTIRMI
jgi:hypothetical protein